MKSMFKLAAKFNAPPLSAVGADRQQTILSGGDKPPTERNAPRSLVYVYVFYAQ